MITEWKNPIQYYITLGDDLLIANTLLGKKIHIKHVGYECLACGMDREIVAMGYCYVDFNKVPQTGPSILHPEKSKAHLGEAERDLDWEKQMQLQPHIVYIAESGGVKVGVTRKKQIPTRWIDQGAVQALPIVETENRYQAGMIEVALKEHLSDKTNYRIMLTQEHAQKDLYETRESIMPYIPKDYQTYKIEESELYQFQYPVLEYPIKIQSITLKKTPEFEARLIGIKGQYLLFENGLAFNVRNHEGYVIELQINS